MKNSLGFEYGQPVISIRQFHSSQRLFVTSDRGGTTFVWDPIDINFEFKNRDLVTVFECDGLGVPTSKVLFYGPAKKAARAICGRCTTDKW